MEKISELLTAKVKEKDGQGRYDNARYTFMLKRCEIWSRAKHLKKSDTQTDTRRESPVEVGDLIKVNKLILLKKRLSAVLPSEFPLSWAS